MIDVALAALPNQSLSIQLGEHRYDIAVQEANGCMVATVVRDGTPVVTGSRLVAGHPVLPYRYEERGNFVLLTDGDALPYYPQFGVTQFLVYLSAAELAELRASNG